MEMRIAFCDGMVNIDGDNIGYTSIKDLYKKGNGSGLQLNEGQEEYREEIQALCDSIANNLYRLECLCR